MKNFLPLFLGVMGATGIILTGHIIFNREAKLKCLESGGSTHRLVTGQSFLGDTHLCVHYMDVKTPFASLK